MQWDHEKTLYFIERYKACNILWDPSHPNHYNKIKREDAWNSLADELECSVDVCKKKMTSLLASLRRERQKIRKSRSAAKGAEESYQSSWFAYKSLLFLMDRDIPGPTKDTLSPQAVTTPPTESNTDSSLKRPLENNIDTATDDPQPRTLKKKRATMNPEEIMRSTFDILQQNTEQSQTNLQKMDECDAFGAYLANKLRSYSKQTRIYVEHHVSNILFSADRGEYEYDTNYGSTSRAPSTSQPVLEPPSPVESDESQLGDHFLLE